MRKCRKCQKTEVGKRVLFCPHCIETFPAGFADTKKYCSDCGLNPRIAGRSRCSLCNVSKCRVCGLRNQYKGICATCAAIEELEPNLQQYLDRLAKMGYTATKEKK